MTVSFVARKCACGGKLDFDSSKKVWICRYCGTVVEREATFDRVKVDGIEGICDVVRQTLMDIANQKLESAGRNLEDCERKNHKHVGTLIANMSYHLAKISCAKNSDEISESLDRMKNYVLRMRAEFPEIAEDEINLYEAFGEGAADIFANLMVVFDTVGDAGRLSYISSKIRPKEIFSPYANKSLLRISIKRGEYDLAEEIISNTNHLDRKSALQEILEHYPDNGSKEGLVEMIFDDRAAEALSESYFEAYFCTSQDSIDTKMMLIERLVETRIRCNAENIVKSLYTQLDSYETAKRFFSALYSVKISDQVTEALLEFCFMAIKLYEAQVAFFDALLEKKVFVVLNSRHVILFLDSCTFSDDEKADILSKILNFDINAKALDTVYNYYLNNNTDDICTRMKLLKVLLFEKAPISVNTIKKYVVKTRTDGEQKLDVIHMFFAIDIHKSYLDDLLAEYLLNATDPKEIKGSITNYLIDMGFKIDSVMLTEYIVSSSDEIEVKILNTEKLIKNGTQVKIDCLDNYLLSAEIPEKFSKKMFQLLLKYDFGVGFQAYSKYVLYCKDIDKARNNDKLLHNLIGDPNLQILTITHKDKEIVCNLLQAYVLSTTDAYDAAQSITNELKAFRMKLNTEISVDGSTTKFKKYVGERKSDLSPLTLQLCQEHKMFSLF